MKADDALAILDTVLKHKPLNDAKEQVFRQIWEGRTYEEMADTLSYEISYIKHVGSQLLLSLSRALGQKVTKSNCHSVLRQVSCQTYTQKSHLASVVAASPDLSDIQTSNQSLKIDRLKAIPSLAASQSAATNQRQDWGSAVKDVSVFYGRHQELALLEQWIVKDRCHLVVLLGMGGVGKTTLSVKLGQQIQAEFDYLIWRSLRNAPLLEDLLLELIEFFANNQQEKDLPTSVEGLVSQLIAYLDKYRCLLILDNIESVLQGGTQVGTYLDGYEGYKELLKRVREVPHQSCLRLTSREKLTEVADMENETLLVRSLQLGGLEVAEGQQFLKARGLTAKEEESRQLIEHYRGNPLALKRVSMLIQDFFNNNCSEFLELGSPVFGSISNLLEQQLHRLTDLEKQVMYWLAINREPVKVSELLEDILPTILPSRLLNALESLERRSMIERSAARFSQQPMLREYISEQLIEQFFQEIVTANPNLLLKHALVKAQAKDYIRESQTRVFLEPLINRLSTNFNSKQELEDQLQRILLKLRFEYSINAGYGCGNLINLLRHLKINRAGYDSFPDFSQVDEKSGSKTARIYKVQDL
jgi:tRNA uridine 5-carbamoylmethylation protein Kti12